MPDSLVPNRALLACGVICGPLYVAVTLTEAFTRAGFDLRQHRFSMLTAGEFGWVHQLAMVGVGVLTILFARGALRGPQGGWGPRCLLLFGAAYVVGGLLTSDAGVGFPLGTTPEMVHATWQGTLQNVSRGASTLCLIAASLVFAARAAAEGRRALAWAYAAAFPAIFLVLTLAGLAIGGNPTALAFLATPWICLTAHALRTYQRAQAHERSPATP